MSFEDETDGIHQSGEDLPIVASVRAPFRMPGPLDVLIVYAIVFLYLIYGGFLLDSAGNKWVSLCFSVGLGLIPLLYSVFAKFDTTAIFRHNLPERRKLSGGLVLILGIFILVILSSALFEPLLPVENETEVALETEVMDSSFLYSVLAVAVLPAIFEEVLCRGFLLSGLVGSISRKRAIVLCSLLFALLHFEPVRIPYTFAAGLALSWAAVETGSLVLPMLMHFLYNFLLFALVRFGNSLPSSPLAEQAGQSVAESRSDTILFVIVGIILLVLGLSLIKIGIRLLGRKTRSEIQQ